MTTGKTAPSFLQNMFIALRAHTPGDEFVFRCSLLRHASVYQIRARAANGVFDDVGYEGCDGQRNDETQKADVEFVGGWAVDGAP